ncbi:hypothetical protein ABVC73_00900 [Prevotella melaninogenica]
MKIKSKLTHMPFLLMGMMVCLIMSCSQEMESNIEQRSTPSGEVSVNFVTNLHGTRGTMYDDIKFISDNDLFGVQGYTTKNGFENMGNDPNFIDNGQTTKSGKVAARNAAAWKNAERYVQLVGTYPLLNGNNSIVKTGKDTYKVTFTPEDDAHKQKDLMLGKSDIEVEPVNGDRDPVNITLHHALTAVNFTLGDKRTSGLKIVGIKLSGVAGKSECKADLAKNTFEWNVIDTGKDYFLKVDGDGIRTTVQNMTQVTGIKDKDGKYDNFSFLMIPQKLGKDAKAIIYLETDTKPIEGDVADGTYSEETDPRKKKRKIVTLKLAGKEWTANHPANYIIEDNLYNNDAKAKYRIGADSYETRYVSKDITVSSIGYYKKDADGKLNKVDSKNRKDEGVQRYYKKAKGTPGVFDVKKFFSYATGIYYYGDGGKRLYDIFPAKQTWEITKYEWTCDDKTTESATTKPSWLTYDFKEKADPRKILGDFTFTIDPKTCPKKLVTVDMTFKQAGNDKEFKVTLAFSLPFPYTDVDLNFIPEDNRRNLKLRSER